MPEWKRGCPLMLCPAHPQRDVEGGGDIEIESNTRAHTRTRRRKLRALKGRKMMILNVKNIYMRTCLFSEPASSSPSESPAAPSLTDFGTLELVLVVSNGSSVVVVNRVDDVVLGAAVVGVVVKYSSAWRFASMLFLMSSFINALSTGFNSGRSFDEKNCCFFRSSVAPSLACLSSDYN